MVPTGEEAATSRRRRFTSIVWDNYKLDLPADGGAPTATCLECGQTLCAGGKNGTSHLHRHTGSDKCQRLAAERVELGCRQLTTPTTAADEPSPGDDNDDHCYSPSPPPVVVGEDCEKFKDLFTVDGIYIPELYDKLTAESLGNIDQPNIPALAQAPRSSTRRFNEKKKKLHEKKKKLQVIAENKKSSSTRRFNEKKKKPQVRKAENKKSSSTRRFNEKKKKPQVAIQQVEDDPEEVIINPGPVVEGAMQGYLLELNELINNWEEEIVIRQHNVEVDLTLLAEEEQLMLLADQEMQHVQMAQDDIMPEDVDQEEEINPEDLMEQDEEEEDNQEQHIHIDDIILD